MRAAPGWLVYHVATWRGSRAAPTRSPAMKLAMVSRPLAETDLRLARQMA